MIDYNVRRIGASDAKEYIHKYHYSHGSHNGPSPCYGLFDGKELIGVLMFSTPCSEAVRASVFGPEHKDWVVELHRLHIKDVTPKNTESWFISRCLDLVREDRPQTKAVLSFSDTTMGHNGTIYKAANAFSIGRTGKATFYMDSFGRLRHPRQNGRNISKKEALAMGWKPVVREAKNRFLWILGENRREHRKLERMCLYDIGQKKSS